MQRQLGVGIIGAGGIAALSHLPEIQEINGLRVVHVAGRQPQRLRTLCERFDVSRYSTDWRALLDDPGVDAVIISLPHPLHAPAALRAIEAGKHVLIQKPLCASMQEADALVAACDAHPELTVYCRPSFAPVIRTMRRLIRQGRIGKISSGAARHSHGGPEVYYAEVADAFGEPYQGDDLWFFDPKQASVGALFDMGVYAVANLVALMGRVITVTAKMATVSKPTLLEDTAMLILEFADGALGIAETSWCDPARTSLTRIHGTDGKLWWPGSGEHLLDFILPSSHTRENAPPRVEHPELPPDENQHAEWLRHIRNGTQPEMSNIRCACHVTEVLLAALASDKLGQPVAVASAPE